MTQLLEAAGSGDEHALASLFTRLYDELKRLAHHVRGGRAGDTLNTTALVHEAWMKLVPTSGASWRDRTHFFAIAARAMRQVLVDAARRQLAAKRGGGVMSVTFEEEAHAPPMRARELIALDDALRRLAAFDERRARVVEHRFFAGLTARETAELLGVSVGTVERDWRSARAWLALELKGGEQSEDGESSA